jgi:hypothetical protein
VETALAHIRIGAETRWFDRLISVDLFSTKKTSTAATQPHYFRALNYQQRMISTPNR